jgi:hypothetical protein
MLPGCLNLSLKLSLLGRQDGSDFVRLDFSISQKAS